MPHQQSARKSKITNDGLSSIIFSLYYLCIVDQRPQGEDVSHQNDQHQGEYDEIQAAVAALIGNGFDHDEYHHQNDQGLLQQDIGNIHNIL